MPLAMHEPPSATEIPVTTEMLRRWPLPMPSSDGDKEGRGRVLIIGGSRETPGTMILAADAALRAGAGKVAIATSASVAGWVAAAVPESRVIAMPESDNGIVLQSALQALDSVLGKIDAILIGPGMRDEPSVCQLVLALLPRLGHAKVLLDAHAMSVVRGIRRCGPASHDLADDSQMRFPGRFDTPVLLTPHAGEMAHLTGGDKAAVQAAPGAIARTAARDWNAIVALKGAATRIAAPDGRLWRHDGGNIGLAVSGSGDTLSGIIAGLAARGASLEQACAWGVVLHAQAADRLAERTGPLGFLVRDLAAEVPMLMHQMRPR